MLEKLIANLKQSLPEPLRKKLGMEDNNHQDEEESVEHSEELAEESHDTADNESVGDADAETGEDKKKKQISMIIRVVVVLGLAYMAIDQFVLKNDETPTTETVNTPVRPARKPKKAPVAPAPDETASVAKTLEAPAEKAPAPENSAPTEQAVAEKPANEPVKDPMPESEAPVENINIADKKIEEVTPPVAAENPAVGEVKSRDTQIDKSLDSLIDSVDQTAKTDKGSANKKTSKLEDKIVADDEYTPPPAYDQLGRGLVYNCKEKYWACLDKSAYVTCNKNMKWNKAHGKATECVVQNVYNSDDDCNIVQKYNVSTSKETSFCQ